MPSNLTLLNQLQLPSPPPNKNLPTNAAPLILNGQHIQQVPTHKFLGVLFDSKLNWKPHIAQAASKGKAATSILKTLAGKTWGADRDMLLRLYKVLVRSKVEYGAAVLPQLPPKEERDLQRVQYLALKTATKLAHTVSYEAVDVEAGIMPLKYRFTILASRHVLKAAQLCPSTQTRLKHLKSLYDLQNLHDLEVTCSSALATTYSDLKQFPSPELEVAANLNPWDLVNLSLLGKVNKTENPAQALAFAKDLIASTTGLAFYTDGSKDPQSGTVGAAFTDAYNFTHASYRLPDGSDVFTAEMFAVLKAIERFYSLQAPTLTIFSDSLSTLQSILSGKTTTRPTILKQILVLLHALKAKSRLVNFVWIPSHVGIKGNDLADFKANCARSLTAIIDLPPTLNQVMKQVLDIQIAKWQSHWDQSEKGRNLYRIQPSVDTPACYSGLTRREQGWIARLRSGHANLAATRHYKGKEIHPFCNYCLHHLDDAVDETVDHFLMDCPKYNCRARLMEFGDFDSSPVTLLKKAAEDSPSGLNARNALTTYLRQTSKVNI